MRALKVMAIGGGAILVGLLTYRQEFAARYHLDTLRKESYRTTRVFGVPIARHQTSTQDDYRNTFAEITGTTPLEAHWLQMRPDCVRSLWGETDICFGLGYELRERQALLEAVFRRFPAQLSRAQAAAFIKRIDELVPADFRQRREPNLEQIHLLRKELGLKSADDSK